MEVVNYRPEMLPELTRLVNGHIRTVPPGWGRRAETRRWRKYL